MIFKVKTKKHQTCYLMLLVFVPRIPMDRDTIRSKWVSMFSAVKINDKIDFLAFSISFTFKFSFIAKNGNARYLNGYITVDDGRTNIYKRCKKYVLKKKREANCSPAKFDESDLKWLNSSY